MNTLRKIRNFFKQENCKHPSTWSGWITMEGYPKNFCIYVTKCDLCGKILKKRSRFGVEE